MTNRSRPEQRSNLTLTLFACPAVALLVWYLVSSHGPARLLLSCYVLIATPLYLLTGSYPPLGSRWFWKAIIPIAAMISIAVYAQMQLTNWFRYIDVVLPARMAFGLTATFAVLEGWVAWRIVDATEPKRKDR